MTKSELKISVETQKTRETVYFLDMPFLEILRGVCGEERA